MLRVMTDCPTANRGVTWTRITSGLKAVGSCTINPTNPDEMYVTTEDQGLWYTSNRRAASPTFTQLAGYPFRFPSRVFYNPYDSNEVWVTSYGNGMRLGRIIEPQPTIAKLQRTGQASLLTVNAATGQKLVTSVSSDLRNWSPISTNVVYANPITVNDTSANSARFYRVSVP